MPIAKPLLLALWLLVASPKWKPWLVPARMVDVLIWVHTAAVLHNASAADARLAIAFVVLESGGDPNAINAQSGACGIIQELGAGRRGHSCAELQADPVLAIRVWFEGLDETRLYCAKLARWRKDPSLGTNRAAIGGIAVGQCGETKLVTERCAWSDGC